mmetsp:Transcript_35872/g.112614  ORF Transcript_35872/g.112614 Transcript_35872/m.112614 type:complete len:168 (+) Transcript_35872:325-828(+)
MLRDITGHVTHVAPGGREVLPDDDPEDDGDGSIGRWGLAALIASLTRKHGGCGCRSAARLASAAYFASVTRVARFHQERRLPYAFLFSRTMKLAQDPVALAQAVVPVVNISEPFCSTATFQGGDPHAKTGAQLLVDYGLTELELHQTQLTPTLTLSHLKATIRILSD